MRNIYYKLIIFALMILSLHGYGQNQKFVELESPETSSGYLAYLLINEVPFPGEYSYVSVADSKAAMMQILWVIHCRMSIIPKGYAQEYLANTKSKNVMDIITADGQCDGFFKDENGRPAFEPRVEERIKYLTAIANKGSKPGKFAELLNYAKMIARNYVRNEMPGKDNYAKLKYINKEAVTGRAYSWMTNKDYFNPGGNFISIPDSMNGALGGNRFYTLKKKD